MKPLLRIFLPVILVTLLLSCSGDRPTADQIFINGLIYTCDSNFRMVEAFAVKDGRILETGSNEKIKKYQAKEIIDLHERPVYPGFIDAHCHFHGYGIDLQKIWLTGTKSWNGILDSLVKYRDKKFMGWLFARGWDQNDWVEKSYPDRSRLDELFPDIPVFLMRIDGHAALVNSKALEISGITLQTKVDGGEIARKGNYLTGLLIDNAVDLVKLKIPEPDNTARTTAILKAAENCFSCGLTSVADAGLDYKVIRLMDTLQQEGKLKMNIYAMVSYDSTNVVHIRKSGKYQSRHLSMRSFKLYADGALGSRGACLHDDYSDRPGHRGFMLSTHTQIEEAASTAFKTGFQLNVHCIGDSANAVLLETYGKQLGGKNNFRWRIEHAQVVRPQDLHYFRDYSIIPSVQPTHATSDMYWAPERLGDNRIQWAYAYKQLLSSAGIAAAGSDFPVEHINPLYGFYAAVSRKDQNGFPEEGFNPEGRLSREEALRAMTCWAAYANFEEDRRGSIEPGKEADFVILRDDIIKMREEELFNASVLETWISGERVFPK